MRIGLDARYVYPDHVHGIGRYSVELLRALLAAGSGHELVAFVQPGVDLASVHGLDCERVECSEKPVSFGTWFSLGKRVVRSGVDVFHSLFPVTPRPRRDWTSVVTFHDMQAVSSIAFSGRRNPLLSVGTLTFYRLSYGRAYREADAVIAISRATATELHKRYGCRETDVIHLGMRQLRSAVAPEEASAVRSRLGLPRTYLLAVGNYRPHKNVASLLRAYARYRSLAGAGALPLAVAGIKDRFFPPIREEAGALGVADSVLFLGYVSDDELSGLYAGATAYVSLSLKEGFGLTALESMAAETPVVVSDRASLPEVVGDAGIVVDPDDTGKVAEVIHRLVLDDELRRWYARVGVQRASRFTWQKTAEETLRVYERILAGDRRRPPGLW